MLEHPEDDKNLLKNNNKIWNNTNNENNLDDIPISINDSHDSVLFNEEPLQDTDHLEVVAKLEEIIKKQAEQLNKQNNHVANIEDKLNNLNLKLIEATIKYETVSILLIHF